MGNVDQNDSSIAEKGPSLGAIVILASVVGIGAAYGYLRSVKPLYRSTAVVYLERQGEPEPDPFSAYHGLKNHWLQTQAAIITSRTMVSAAMADPNVESLVTSGDERHLRDILRTLSASVRPKTDLVTVSACSTTPEDAASVVNAVVRAFARWNEPPSSKDTSDWYDSLLDEFDQCLRTLGSNLELQMWAYKQENVQLVWNSAKASYEDLDFVTVELVRTNLQALAPKSHEWFGQFYAACSLAYELTEKTADQGQHFMATNGGEGSESPALSQQHSECKQIISNCTVLAAKFRSIRRAIPFPHPRSCFSSFTVRILEWARPATEAHWPRPLPVYGTGWAAGLLLGTALGVAQRRRLATCRHLPIRK